MSPHRIIIQRFPFRLLKIVSKGSEQRPYVIVAAALLAGELRLPEVWLFFLQCILAQSETIYDTFWFCRTCFLFHGWVLNGKFYSASNCESGLSGQWPVNVTCLSDDESSRDLIFSFFTSKVRGTSQTRQINSLDERLPDTDEKSHWHKRSLCDCRRSSDSWCFRFNSQRTQKQTVQIRVISVE